MLGAAVLGLTLVACSEPAFELVVRFPGPVAVEPEAPVYYRGVRVGEVVEVALHQATPRESARVAVRLRLDDREIVLREGDRFEVASGGLLGSARIQISPSEEPAEPLASGAVVEGVPPTVTRLRESVADALESLSDAAAEAADEVAAELSRTLGAIELEVPPPSEEVPEPEAPGESPSAPEPQ